MLASRRSVSNVLLALAFFAALGAHAPAIWLEGRFFADEADYFGYAWHASPLDALLAPQLGYWALWTNLGTTIGAHVLPLELAPLACVALGTAALGAVVWTLLRRGSPFVTPAARTLALALVLVVPPGYGRTNVTFAHFWLASAAAVVLVSDERRGVWSQRALLVTAGLAGVVPAFLAPLFALRAVLDRSRARAWQAALLALAGALQLVVHLVAGAAHASRFATPEPDVLAASLVNHSLVHPFAGRTAMVALGERAAGPLARADGTTTWLVASACGLALAAVAWVVGRRGTRAEGGPGSATATWLVAAAFAIALPSLVGGTPCGASESKLCYLSSQFRYFATPNALLALAVLARALEGRGPRRVALRVVTAVLLVAGLRAFLFDTPRTQLEGPSWRAEVAAWRADPSHPIAVWPARWPPLRLSPR